MKPDKKPIFEKETFVNIKDNYNTYIVSKCKECKKLFWTRKYYYARYCSAACQMQTRKKYNGICPSCWKQVPRNCPNGRFFQKKKYCSSICFGKMNRGSNNIFWKGGKRVGSKGYVLIKDKKPGKYIMEHRLVMEKFIGRKLKSGEIVHHINNIRTDNRIKNLMLFKNHAEHTKHHERLRSKLRKK